ncbi:MAG: DegT/DnrJ/EryC1/StrS family aminotransferase [Verrucomicrobia bacterium]|nr:DegT/DnrJ/EryC1/StrS family aminotransferase [Verrucomicrobiota bacterium]
MPVPLLDLKPQYAALRAEIDLRLREVIDSQVFILGPVVARFEAETKAHSRAAWATGMSSGTDAQLAILMALGIGPGDAVITSTFTFFATAGCVARVGARTIFGDIDPATFNLAPDWVEHYLRTVARRDAEGVLRTPAGDRLRAIIPVHLFGLCAEMDRFLALGREFGLEILEDASQAIGAEYRHADGSVGSAGAMGRFGWFSYFPSKNLGAFGDAGSAVGTRPEDEAVIRAMRMHGMTQQYYHEVVGGNFRLDAMQAAVLSAKLPHLDGWSDARRANAARYREAFQAAGLTERIQVPQEPFAGRGLRQHHIYHQYVIRTPQRDDLLQFLRAAEIGCAIYYPLPLHQQQCFAAWGGRAGDCPQAEAAAAEVLALPIYPELTEGQIDEVVARVAEFFRSR